MILKGRGGAQGLAAMAFEMEGALEEMREVEGLGKSAERARIRRLFSCFEGISVETRAD